MRHRVKKVKFSKGQDAHQALMKKLVLSFLKAGRVDIPLARAKALKSRIDRLTAKAVRGGASDLVMLQKYLGKKTMRIMTETIAPIMKNRIGGYVSMVKLGPRQGDNAEIARIEWIEKVILTQDTSAPVKEEKVPAENSKKSNS